MNRFISFMLIALLLISCSRNASEELTSQTTSRISIFEVYFRDAKSVDDFSVFLEDTLKLPTEWRPFDLFGNGVVQDAAFYLGNTTLELLALNTSDSTMLGKARFNRILFHSNEIDKTSKLLKKAGLQFNPPFDFKIYSDESELIIGKQINLDSLSKKSNVNISFWQYVDAGYNFSERHISGKSLKELEMKLNPTIEQNPLGIIGLKEVHLSIDKKTIGQWKKLLGNTQKNKWLLKDGPIISYITSEKSFGVEWIAVQVRDLNIAKVFLSKIGISFSTYDERIAIEPSEVYGLTVLLEE